MALVQQIDEDLKNAMRAKDAAKLSVLRMLKSAVKYAAIERGADVLDDAGVAQVVRKQVKQREDSIAGFEKGGRPELAEKEKFEVEVLKAYLPAALTEAEIDHLVKEAIAETGATGKAQMGAVMKVASAKAAGRADGKQLSAAVARQLSA
jgi:uncharacterized protein YqeY